MRNDSGLFTLGLIGNRLMTHQRIAKHQRIANRRIVDRRMVNRFIDTGTIAERCALRDGETMTPRQLSPVRRIINDIQVPLSLRIGRGRVRSSSTAAAIAQNVSCFAVTPRTTCSEVEG